MFNLYFIVILEIKDTTKLQVFSLFLNTLEKLEHYKKATTYLGAQWQKQKTRIKGIKDKISEAEDDNKFYEQQITKLRNQKPPNSMNEYISFVQGMNTL